MFDRINGREGGQKKRFVFQRVHSLWERQGNNENTRSFNQSVNQLISIKQQLITSSLFQAWRRYLQHNSTLLKNNGVHSLSLGGSIHAGLLGEGVLSRASIGKSPSAFFGALWFQRMPGRQVQPILWFFPFEIWGSRQSNIHLGPRASRGQSWDWSPQVITPPLTAREAGTVRKKVERRERQEPPGRPGKVPWDARTVDPRW